MARRDTGRATYQPGCWLRPFAFTFAFVFMLGAALSVPHIARAARLIDVRIGKHDQFTRVVLELDALAGYQVFEPDASGDPVMELHLEAGASARRVNAPEALATSVEVEPSGAKTVVRVALRKPELLINEMILLSPPRIVFDLRDPAGGMERAASVQEAAGAGPASTSRPEPKDRRPVAAQAGETAKVAEAVETKPKRKGQAPVSPARRGDAPAPAAARGGASEPVAALDDAGVVAGSEAPAMGSDGSGAPSTDPLTSLTQAAAETRSDINPQGLPFDPSAAPDSDLANARRRQQLEQQTGRAIPPVAPLRPRAVAPRAPSAPQASLPPSSQASWQDRLVGLTGGNLLYLGAAALVVVLALGVVLRRRGERDDVLSPVMAAHDLGSEDALFDDPDSVTEPVPVPVGAGLQAPIGAVSKPAPSRVAPSAPTAPSSPAAAAGEAPGTGMETRIASLESSLQQLIQAREQIERQLAAQTEELRVQRAAIARTQRAVRTIGEREDEGGATEPVPRAPAS